jgi:hypothetical protein
MGIPRIEEVVEGMVVIVEVGTPGSGANGLDGRQAAGKMIRAKSKREKKVRDASFIPEALLAKLEKGCRQGSLSGQGTLPTSIRSPDRRGRDDRVGLDGTAGAYSPISLISHVSAKNGT